MVGAPTFQRVRGLAAVETLLSRLRAQGPLVSLSHRVPDSSKINYLM